VKKLRLTIRSGRGLPEGVHWATELYFWSTRQTRLDLVVVVVVEGEEEGEEDSREFRGRIRMATIIPSSAAVGGVVVVVVVGSVEVASLVDIVLF